MSCPRRMRELLCCRVEYPSTLLAFGALRLTLTLQIQLVDEIVYLLLLLLLSLLLMFTLIDVHHRCCGGHHRVLGGRHCVGRRGRRSPPSRRRWLMLWMRCSLLSVGVGDHYADEVLFGIVVDELAAAAALVTLHPLRWIGHERRLRHHRVRQTILHIVVRHRNIVLSRRQDQLGG